MVAARLPRVISCLSMISATLVILVGCGGGGGGGGGGSTSTPDTTAPQVASVTISTPVASSPNPVSISADVTDDRGVTSVTATITPTSVLKTGQSDTVALTKGAGDTWSASGVQLKGNSTTSAVPFSVSIAASDAAANNGSGNGSSSIPTALPPASP